MSESNSNKQWKRVPFDIELAKKIQAGEIEGKIVTHIGEPITKIVFLDSELEYDIVAVVREKIHTYTTTGHERSWDMSGRWLYDLTIELPEETPKQEVRASSLEEAIDIVKRHPITREMTYEERLKAQLSRYGL